MTVTNITPRVNGVAAPGSIKLRREDTVTLTMTTTPASAAARTTWYVLNAGTEAPVDFLSGGLDVPAGQIGRGGVCDDLDYPGDVNAAGYTTDILSSPGAALSAVNDPPWTVAINSTINIPVTSPGFPVVAEQDPNRSDVNPTASTTLDVTINGDTIVPGIGYVIDTPDHARVTGKFYFTCVATPSAGEPQFVLSPPQPAGAGESMNVSADPYSTSMLTDYVDALVWTVNGNTHDTDTTSITIQNVQGNQEIELSGRNCDGSTFVYETTGFNIDLKGAAQFDGDNGVGFLTDPDENFSSGEISVGNSQNKTRTSINGLYDSVIDLSRAVNSSDTSLQSTYNDLITNSNVYMPNSSTSSEIRFSNFQAAQCLACYWYGTSESRGGSTYAGETNDGNFAVYVNANSITPDTNPSDNIETGEVRVTINTYKDANQYYGNGSYSAAITPVLIDTDTITRHVANTDDVAFLFTSVNTHLSQRTPVGSQGDRKSWHKLGLPLNVELELYDDTSKQTQLLHIPKIETHSTVYDDTGFAFGDFSE